MDNNKDEVIENIAQNLNLFLPQKKLKTQHDLSLANVKDEKDQKALPTESLHPIYRHREIFQLHSPSPYMVTDALLHIFTALRKQIDTSYRRELQDEINRLLRKKAYLRSFKFRAKRTFYNLFSTYVPEPLNELCSKALVSTAWRDAVGEALRGWSKGRDSLKIFSSHGCLAEYQKVLADHFFLAQADLERYRLAGDLAFSRTLAERVPNVSEDLTWLPNSDHIFMHRFIDVSNFRLGDTLGRLFGPSVRHLVLANFDLDLPQLLGHFTVLETLVLVRLPDCRYRQRALFNFLRSPGALPSLTGLHVLGEKTWSVRWEVRTLEPLLNRLTSLSLPGYNARFDNQVELMAALEGVKRFTRGRARAVINGCSSEEKKNLTDFQEKIMFVGNENESDDYESDDDESDDSDDGENGEDGEDGDDVDDNE